MIKKCIIVLSIILNFGCANHPLEYYEDIMTEEEKDKYLCKRIFSTKEEYKEHLKKGFCIDLNKL